MGVVLSEVAARLETLESRMGVRPIAVRQV